MPTTDERAEGILLDSSVWRRTHLLRSHEGEALIHNLRSQNRRLVVPEVVEWEIAAIAQTEASEAFDKITRLLRDLRNFSGYDMSFALPEIDALGHGAQRRLDELEDILVRMPMTLDHAQRALGKAIQKLPPNSEKKEQFRDTLIWECVLSSSDTFSSVYFVSEDGQFFGPKGDGRALATNLASEISGRDANVICYEKLLDCLVGLGAASPSVNAEAILQRTEDWARQHLNNYFPDVSLGARRGGRVLEYSSDDQIRTGVFELNLWLRISYLTHGGPRDELVISGELHGDAIEVKLVSATWDDERCYSYGAPHHVAIEITRGPTFRLDLHGWNLEHSPFDAIGQFSKRFDENPGLKVSSPLRWSGSGGSRDGGRVEGEVLSMEHWRVLLRDLQIEENWIMEMSVIGPNPWPPVPSG